MNDFGEHLEPGTVRFERLLPGPIERVWTYLTDSEKRGTWLAGGMMELWVGGTIELNFHHANLAAAPGPIPEKYKTLEGGSTTRGRITRIEPPTLLSYTWVDKPGEESEVTFELESRDAQVMLTLTHRRLNGRDELIGVSGGWHTHLEILGDLLRGKEPPAFWPLHMAMETEYERRLDPANVLAV
jgi:uncharacterized protein YndB with AHSA1/START domain